MRHAGSGLPQNTEPEYDQSGKVKDTTLDRSKLEGIKKPESDEVDKFVDDQNAKLFD